MNYSFGGNVLDDEVAGRGGGGEGSCAEPVAWKRPCDGCRGAPSVVYCHADAAYLCASCDTRVHAANCVASRHERVRVCEACERAPAVLECRADAAALCALCDAQVHSANALAGRHQRVPVLPLPVAAAIPPAASVLAEAAAAATAVAAVAVGGGDKEEEVDSWLLLTAKDPVSDNNNCNCSSNDNNNISSNTSTFYGDVDEYFDLVGYNSYCENHINSNAKQYGMQEHLLLQKEFGDKEGSEYVVPYSQVKQQQSGYRVIGAEQAASMTTAGVSAYTDSISNSISFSSSMEVGVVPDNMAATDMPYSSILLTPAGAISLFSPGPSLQMPLHLTSMDREAREARVLRYKEKKKSRKFEKTIRYETTKTYAEARPRIKGRFAKRSADMEIEVDQMFSTAALSSDGSYGTVPWF